MKQREWPDVRFPDSSKFHIDRLTFQVTLVDRILVNQISGILGSTDMWALTSLDRARRRLVLLGLDVACSGLCRGLAVVHYSHHMKKHTRKKNYQAFCMSSAGPPTHLQGLSASSLRRLVQDDVENCLNKWLAVLAMIPLSRFIPTRHILYKTDMRPKTEYSYEVYISKLFDMCVPEVSRRIISEYLKE